MREPRGKQCHDTKILNKQPCETQRQTPRKFRETECGGKSTKKLHWQVRRRAYEQHLAKQAALQATHPVAPKAANPSAGKSAGRKVSKPGPVFLQDNQDVPLAWYSAFLHRSQLRTLPRSISMTVIQEQLLLSFLCRLCVVLVSVYVVWTVHGQRPSIRPVL